MVKNLITFSANSVADEPIGQPAIGLAGNPRQQSNIVQHDLIRRILHGNSDSPRQ